ncbi:hypothetical protein B566_EDAN009681 [Ephemera danica]|nr:hypothetical protein B566_EDAN009681 [Ephemera danica]
MEASTIARVFAAKNAIVIILICHLPSLGIAQASSKLRVCVVAPRDSSMSVARQCADLAASEKAVAVCDDPAPDRLTCLRRVMTGRADLTVLQAEDLLVAARHISEDITVINELRALEKQRYEYEVAAVVRNSANITSVARLRNSTFCHPGYGYETDWNGVVSRFLESRVVPQSCDPDLTLAENSLNSAAQFWHAACKAGQWVPDLDLDAELKSRYSSLCAICDTPRDCSSLDKYWGRNGPLVCLTDGAGDVLWARLDHIKLHFAPEDPDSVAEGDISEYSFLCSNGSLQPLEVIQAKKPRPCVWISRPWPVVVAHRTRAGDARELVHSLARAEPDTWQSSLSLLVAPLTIGWLNAATVNPCVLGALSTPRMCVAGHQVETKCQWLTEAARAHGIRGAPICVMPKEDCLADVAAGVADLASIHPDLLYTAVSKHGLKVLLYEQPRTPNELYLVSAVVTNPNLRKLDDLKGKRACFPTYNGASWQLTLAALKEKKQVPERCDSDEKSMLSYFSSVCVAHNSSNLASSVPLCSEQTYKGDELDAASADLAALRCLAEGRGDVAFVSNGTVELVESKTDPSWAHHLKVKDFRYACFLNQRQKCQLGWAPHGMVSSHCILFLQLCIDSGVSQLVTRNSERGANVRQWRTMFEQLDDFFGPRQHSPISSMLIYGPFDNKTNLLFHVIRERHSSCPSLATHPAVSLGVLILMGLLAML